jgi:hypothetical protein
LREWPRLVGEAIRTQALWRLGLQRSTAEAEEALVRAFEVGLGESRMQPDRAWYEFRGGRLPADVHPAFAPFAEQLAGFRPVDGALAHPYWADGTPCTMLIDEVEDLWRPIAEADDWAPLTAKIAAIRRMAEAHGASPATAQRRAK